MTAPRVTTLGRTDDMLLVRGINVFPSASMASPKTTLTVATSRNRSDRLLSISR